MRISRRHRNSILLGAAFCLFSLCSYGSPAKIHAKAARDEASTKAESGGSSGRVNEIRFFTLGEATRIAIEVTSNYKLKSDRLQNPDRLFFDIVGVKPGGKKGIQTIEVGDTLVRKIRVAETQPGTTRIVL